MSGFKGNTTFTFGFINLNLTVKPYEQLIDFMLSMHRPLIIAVREALDPQT